MNMEIVAITEAYWSEDGGEMIDTGIVLSYEARGCDGTVLGRGETKREAAEAAYVAMYPVESATRYLTNRKRGRILAE